ncbi:hypothetical protein Peur_013416 [Populus x canadensis]
MCGRKLKGGRNLGLLYRWRVVNAFNFFVLRSISLLAAISSDHIVARSPVPRTKLSHDRTVVFINLTVESRFETIKKSSENDNRSHISYGLRDFACKDHRIIDVKEQQQLLPRFPPLRLLCHLLD